MDERRPIKCWSLFRMFSHPNKHIPENRDIVFSLFLVRFRHSALPIFVLFKNIKTEAI
jgi:hypothetical protein